MENSMIRNQTRMLPSTPSAALSIHMDSKAILKPKPKIRIIHVFAPEIIKTDVANFRELVQRLTGKPHQEKGYKPRIARKDHTSCEKPVVAAAMAVAAKKIEVRTGFLAGMETISTRVKEEEEEEEEGNWTDNISENSSGFLNGFGDLDGFIQELGDQFPLLPFDASHHMHGFEEAQLA